VLIGSLLCSRNGKSRKLSIEASKDIHTALLNARRKEDCSCQEGQQKHLKREIVELLFKGVERVNHHEVRMAPAEHLGYITCTFGGETLRFCLKDGRIMVKVRGGDGKEWNGVPGTLSPHEKALLQERSPLDLQELKNRFQDWIQAASRTSVSRFSN